MPRPRTMVFITAGVLGLLLLALAGFVRPVRELFRTMLLPIARFTSSAGAGVGQFLRLDESTKTANERAEELDARLHAISVDYARLRALEEENRSLRAQANFITESGLPTVGARVIARAMRDDTAAITIDRGAHDGVEVGQAVVTDDGLFVGKIFSLGDRTASVLLVTDVRSRVAGAAAGTGRLAGVVDGQGNGTARFTLIPQSVPLKRDDVVVTAGTEDKVPANLVIGLVNAVESQPTDPFKSAAIEPLAPLDRLELVSVIVPHQ